MIKNIEVRFSNRIYKCVLITKRRNRPALRVSSRFHAQWAGGCPGDPGDLCLVGFVGV